MLRDQRMRELLFETGTHPTARIQVAVPTALLNSLSAGQSTQADITARVNLHGVEKSFTTRVSIQRLTNSRVLVQSMAPVIAKAADFGMVDGVERLRAIVNLVSISSAVAVDFSFAFNAR